MDKGIVLITTPQAFPLPHHTMSSHCFTRLYSSRLLHLYNLVLLLKLTDLILPPPTSFKMHATYSTSFSTSDAQSQTGELIQLKTHL